MVARARTVQPQDYFCSFSIASGDFIAESSSIECRHDLLQYPNRNQYHIFREIFGYEKLVRRRKIAFQFYLRHLDRNPTIFISRGSVRILASQIRASLGFKIQIAGLVVAKVTF